MASGNMTGPRGPRFFPPRPMFRPRSFFPPFLPRPFGARLDIVPSILTSYENNADLSTYTTTDSIAPEVNRLVLLWVVQTAAAANGPTSFGGPLAADWTLVRASTTAVNGIWLYRAMVAAAPTPGQVVVNFGAGDGTTGLNLVVSEYDNVDRSGTQGSGAILQVYDGNQGASTTVPVVLSNSMENSKNLHAYGITLAVNDATIDIGGAPYVRRARNNHANPGRVLMVADGLNDLRDDPAWTTSANARWINVEIKSRAA